MKKSVLVVVLFLMTITVFSQNVLVQTTVDEFNYITKGYAVQKESGLDMKRGYELKFKHKHSSTFGKKRTTEFFDLYKEDFELPVAIMVVFYANDNPDAKSYFCIPGYHSENEVWKLALDYWQEMTKQWNEVASSHFWNTFTALSLENTNKVKK